MELSNNLCSRVLPLWLFPTNAPLKKITPQEEFIAKGLPENRSRQYKHARGYARLAISTLFGIDPLKVPLNAAPGQAPELPYGWGYLSFSHCSDGLLLGWSNRRIGVDIEKKDRKFAATKIAKRYFDEEEIRVIKHCKKANFQLKTLEYWVIKEASIKCQRGSLAKDLIQWKWEEEMQISIHKLLKSPLNTFLIDYKSWLIAVAYQGERRLKKPIICLC